MLVDTSSARGAVLAQALADNGYEVVARVHDTKGILRMIEDIQPDVVIIDMDSPDRDTLENMSFVTRHQPRPIVLFTDDDDPVKIQTAVRAGVSAYVVAGVDTKRIKPIMDVAIARFREYQALREDLTKAQNTLADRKLIDRAKGILMQQRGVSEDDAYQLLRRAAMDNNEKVADIARKLVDVSKLLV
jgi:response regulator NasT